MEELVLKAIQNFNLIEGVKHITVALSGGADSMSLLYVLVSLQEKLGIEVSAAHFNHLIRGDEAYRDESFVKSVCEQLGVELISERGDVPAYAAKHRLSTELAAREMRYRFFEKINRGAVATAHTASDNLETVIFNLTRGTSLKGLCGIPPKRGIFIRPLILCTRDDVEEYCAKNDVEYVTDSTNLSDDYSRNKIRHGIIPQLKLINPSVEHSVIRMSTALREDDDFINTAVDRYCFSHLNSDGNLDVSDYENFSPVIVKSALKKAFEAKSTATLDNRHINLIFELSKGGRRINLPGKMCAYVEDSLLKITPVNEKQRENVTFSVQTNIVDNNLFKKGQKVNNLLLKNLLDCDKIVGKLVVRTRLPGDSIRLKNRGATKTLKKLYNECHIPLELRNSLPVISDDRGVIWICGIGVSERCAVTDKTEKIFRITVDRQDKNAF